MAPLFKFIGHLYLIKSYVYVCVYVHVQRIILCGGDQHSNNIKGVPTHGGRYVQYNVYGNLFEVSRKYVPPIRPVGRGAYGIVW